MEGQTGGPRLPCAHVHTLTTAVYSHKCDRCITSIIMHYIIALQCRLQNQSFAPCFALSSCSNLKPSQLRTSLIQHCKHTQTGVLFQVFLHKVTAKTNLSQRICQIVAAKRCSTPVGTTATGYVGS